MYYRVKCLQNENYMGWGYNPKDNSTMHLGKYFESEEEAWTTFK